MSIETDKYLSLKKDITELSNKKIRIEERYKTSKAALEKLLKEITDKGYDPKKLAEIRSEKQEKINKDLEDLSSKVCIVEKELKTIEDL